MSGRKWNFYATDTDRSWGWSNHVYTLGHAFEGFGDTADSALAEARASRRENIVDFIEGTERSVDDTPEQHEIHALGGLVAIPDDCEEAVLVDPIAVALAYYRQHTGPATRADAEQAANRKGFQTLAWINALEHAGIEVRR